MARFIQEVLDDTTIDELLNKHTLIFLQVLKTRHMKVWVEIFVQY